MRPFGLILLSTAALVAQAPTAKGNERLAALVAEVKQLQKNLKFKEALAKAEAVLPAAAPGFPDNDLKGIGESLDKTEEMLFLLDLNASAASESGEWEKVQISEPTVKAHVTEILRKLSVTSRTQAVILAQRLSLEPVTKAVPANAEE